MSRDTETIDADGLFVREMRPASAPRGAFLLLHGMESHSAWFVETSTRLVSDGWAVIAFDRAGSGKSPGTRGHLASYHHFVEHTTRIAVKTREKYGTVHLAGMSWGGMAALYLGLRRGWLFDSLTLIAPGIAAQQDISFGGKLCVARDFLRKKPSTLVAPVFRPEHFTRNAEWRDYIANDPDRLTQVTTSFCIETMKMRRFIKENAGLRLLPPTLCLLAGDDRIIDNQLTASVCRKAGAVVEIIPDSAHTLIFECPEQTSAILSRHAATTTPPSGSGRVWIIGAGAVGGAVASLLSFGGVETGVLVKPAYLQQMARDGLTLQSGNAARTTGDRLSFAGSPETLPPDPDLVILAIKGFDTPSALAGLAGRIPTESVIASLQNGVDNEEEIAKKFPGNTIVAASICASLELARPGLVSWADDRGGLGAALYKGSAEIARTVWTSLMTRTGMECRWYAEPNDSTCLKWSKLMLNTGFNALNSVTGLTSAQILADERYGDLALSALREGFAAMEHQGLRPVDLPGFPVSKMRRLLKAPTSLAARVMSWQAARSSEAAFSMRQDMIKKRQHTEITELNGKIVEISRRFGFPAPANEKLVKMVTDFQKNNIS
jgi:2-dehydropantoate 2-reductase